MPNPEKETKPPLPVHQCLGQEGGECVLSFASPSHIPDSFLLIVKDKTLPTSQRAFSWGFPSLVVFSWLNSPDHEDALCQDLPSALVHLMPIALSP